MSQHPYSAATLVGRRRLLASLAVAGLSGCQHLGSSQTSRQSTTQRVPDTDSTRGRIDLVTDYGGEDWNAKWEREIVPGWQSRSEVPVHIERPLGPDWPARLRTLVDEGTPPELYHCQLPEIADLVASGATQPVDGLVDDLAAANGNLVTDRSIRIAGTTHLVPHGLVLGSVLCYRTDVYDALGLSPPETWAALRSNARVIDEAESFDGRGFAVAADDPRSDTKAGMDLRTWLATAGGSVWQWADRDRQVAELAFRPESVRPALTLLRDLDQYSPDSAGLGYAETIAEWVTGNVGQCLFINAWLAGAAATAGRDQVARNTAVTLPPLMDQRTNSIDRGWAMVDGTPIFRDADEVGAAEEFLRYLYDGQSRQAEMNLIRPMQYLPPYEGVLTNDAYRTAPVFNTLDGHLYDLNRRLVEDIAPHMAGDRPRTAATWYAQNGTILADLVRSVLVDGEPLEPAIERTRSRLTARLEAGQQFSSG